MKTISTFEEAMNEVVAQRGGKLRVPNAFSYTYFVNQDLYDDAVNKGYIDDKGNVTDKFTAEYEYMFDSVGLIMQ